MLNTDLHNPNIPDEKKMKKEEFVSNNRGINDGKDLPRELLEGIYDTILTDPITLKEMISLERSLLSASARMKMLN